MRRHHFQEFFCQGRHGEHGRRGGGFFDRWAAHHPGGHSLRGALRGARLISSDDLQLIILSLLAEKPRHGYELIKQIGEQTSGIYKPSPGMIYPALTYLEEVSFAESETEGTKKLYRITKAGTEFLEQNRERMQSITDQLARYGERMAHFQDQMAQDEAVDERWGGSPKDQEKKEWRQMKSEFHEIRHELKAALIEKLSAPMEEKKRVLAILKKAIAEIRKK